MSISKLLMTVAVCTVSMSAVSTSYGSGTDLATDDLNATPSMRSLAAFDGSNVTKPLPEGLALAARNRRGTDSMSQHSSTSTITNAAREVLKAIGNELFEGLAGDLALPTEVELARGKSGVGKLQVTVSKLLNRYLSLRSVLKEFMTIRAAVLPESVTKEITDLNVTTAEILEAVKQQQEALVATKVALTKSEKTAAAWKAATIVTSGVLTIVVGVLTNIIWTRGLAVLWENNFFTKV
jgi:hypothetical protein